MTRMKLDFLSMNLWMGYHRISNRLLRLSDQPHRNYRPEEKYLGMLLSIPEIYKSDSNLYNQADK